MSGSFWGSHLEKNIGKHGEGIACIDDVSDPLKRFEHGFSGNFDFHGDFASDLPALCFLCRPEKLLRLVSDMILT